MGCPDLRTDQRGRLLHRDRNRDQIRPTETAWRHLPVVGDFQRFALCSAGGWQQFRGPRYAPTRHARTFSSINAPINAGLFIPFFYIVDYAHDLAIPARMTFIVLAVMNAGGVIGRIAPAYLSDTLGRFNLLAPAAFLSGVLCVLFWMFARALVPLMLFAAAYGFTSGAFISVITPCVAQISDIRQIGSRIGILYSIISFP
jgi:MFS family permease